MVTIIRVFEKSGEKVKSYPSISQAQPSLASTYSILAADVKTTDS